MKQCVWVMEYSLGKNDPALRLYPDAPAVFIFDENWYQKHPTAFKRLFFVYESIVETFAERKAPAEIRRGDVVREVFDFCRKHDVEEIHVTRSETPRYHLYLEQLRANFVVIEHRPEELVTWPGRAPHRFMDFWKKVLPRVLPAEEK